MYRTQLLLLASFLLVVGQAGAQELTPKDIEGARIVAGDMVRLQVASRNMVFKYVDHGDDVLWLRPVNSDSVVDVPFGVVDRLDVMRRRDLGVAAGRGALAGGLVGGVIGAIAGFADGDDPPGWFSFSAEDNAMILGLGLGGMGATLGAVIGLIAPGSDWKTVAITNRVTVLPTGSGVLFALKL